MSVSKSSGRISSAVAVHGLNSHQAMVNPNRAQSELPNKLRWSASKVAGSATAVAVHGLNSHQWMVNPKALVVAGSATAVSVHGLNSHHEMVNPRSLTEVE